MARSTLHWCAVSVALVASPAAAVTIGYGDCENLAGGGTVIYEDVTESNAESTALYYAPSCAQNLIDFDPNVSDGLLGLGFLGVAAVARHR